MEPKMINNEEACRCSGVFSVGESSEDLYSASESSILNSQVKDIEIGKDIELSTESDDILINQQQYSKAVTIVEEEHSANTANDNNKSESLGSIDTVPMDFKENTDQANFLIANTNIDTSFLNYFNDEDMFPDNANHNEDIDTVSMDAKAKTDKMILIHDNVTNYDTSLVNNLNDDKRFPDSARQNEDSPEIKCVKYAHMINTSFKEDMDLNLIEPSLLLDGLLEDGPLESHSPVGNSIPWRQKKDFENTQETRDVLVARLPSGAFVGIKLFQDRPESFSDDAARLEWDSMSAKNAIRLKQELESGQTKPAAVANHLETDLNLSDEHKVNLEKELEHIEKKHRVQFLKTEMALVKLDCEIKACVKLDEADTECCLKLLDDMQGLEVEPLMLLKHPTVLESIKRLRCYVGNIPAWEMSPADANTFNKQAHLIRKCADNIYTKYRNLFGPPQGLSFWEYYSARVMHFKKVTADMLNDEKMVMVHEPPEMKEMTPHTTQAAVDAANRENASSDEENEGLLTEKKSVPVKLSEAEDRKSTGGKRQSKRSEDDSKSEEPAKKRSKESAKKTDKDPVKSNMKKKSYFKME